MVSKHREMGTRPPKVLPVIPTATSASRESAAGDGTCLGPRELMRRGPSLFDRDGDSSCVCWLTANRMETRSGVYELCDRDGFEPRDDFAVRFVNKSAAPA